VLPNTMSTDTDYDEQVEEEIPGMVYVFSLIDDEENESPPAIISHVDEYELPDHIVRERKADGGICAFALLKILESTFTEGGSRKKKMTWADALEAMHEEIEDEEGGRRSLPTLSTTRPINIREERLRIVSTAKRGVKRALLIGAHYQDEAEENVWLASCHKDVRGLRNHLIHKEGFEKENVLVMMDDDRHHEPTKGHILDALVRMCQISETGDSIFVHFSGHGGTLMNQAEYDESGITHQLLAPGDYRDNGVLIDDELYASFVTQVPEGVHAVAVIDTCHPPPSQTGKTSALDLPYVCEAGEDEVRPSEGFRRALMASAVAGAGITAGAAALASKSKKKKKPKKKKHDEGEADETETQDRSYDDGSSESEKPKRKEKSEQKKKKVEADADAEEEDDMYDNSYEAGSDESEKPKQKKKYKPKKKKKEESSFSYEEDVPEELQEEEKPKKKKKKSKKK